MATRPSIPQSIKRQVRQRCHFGCILCGAPVYRYDHIVEWSEVGEHNTENLTLLCPAHHDAKTRGRLSRDAIVRANENPYNSTRLVTSGEKIIFGRTSPTIIIGSNWFTSESIFYPFVIDGSAPIKVYPDEDNSVLFDITLRDKYNWPLLVIEANEVQVSTHNWDVTWEGGRLVLREAAQSILLVMHFDVSSNSIVIERGQLYWNGAIIMVDKEGLRIPGAHVETGESQFHGPIGFQVGPPGINQPVPSRLFCFDVNRYENHEST